MMNVAAVAGLAVINEGPVGTAAAVGEAAKRTPEKAVDALIQAKDDIARELLSLPLRVPV